MNDSQDIEELPCSDTELRDGLAFLSSNSPAFQRYQRELQQEVIDRLFAANCLIVATIRDYQCPKHLVEVFQQLQEINRNVMQKVRGVPV